MLSPEHIAWFYDSVLDIEEINYAISQSEIQNAIRNMAKAYRPDKSNWNRQEVGIIADYNDAAHRCAYLHKYAPLHTYLVQDIFHKALTECYALQKNMFSRYDSFNICSLGGGPGTDIIGIISACQPFGYLPYSVQVVDLFSGWENTFNSLAEALRIGCYGSLSLNFDAKYLNCMYTADNLLHAIDDNKVCKSIGSADLITMVKFVSAVACKNTEAMVKKIFDNMKPGAMVLFIDNAAGGFRQMILRSAKECKLVAIYGPINHKHYLNPEFDVVRYGYPRCFETRVTVQLLKKLSQPKFALPDQNWNPSPVLTPKITDSAYNEATRVVYNSKLTSFSQVTKPPFSSKRLFSPLSETTPLCQNRAAAFSTNSTPQPFTKTYGTDVSRNLKIKSDVSKISPATSTQSNKRELYENSNQSMGTFTAECFEQLPTFMPFKSQKLNSNTKLSSKINEDSNRADSLLPVSQTGSTKGTKESVTKKVVPIALNANGSRNCLPVIHSPPPKNLNKSSPKKVAPIAPNVKDNRTCQPISHPSPVKMLSKRVIKNTPTVKDNLKDDPVVDDSSSKPLSSSVPKKVAPVTPYVIREIQSKIVTLPPTVSQGTSSSASGQDHPSDQNQSNAAKLFRALLSCFCMEKCCEF